ncbi:aldose epimerase family protein [[Pseudomonas] boreopolis]
MQRPFGTMPDGTDVHAIALENDHGLRAEVLTYGGILRRLEVPAGDGHVDVVLGLADLPAYLADHDSLGILVGRFGNRIANGRFVLDGVEHQLSRNEGPNHLHGGVRGFGHRLWEVRERSRERVLLARVSPAGEEGYPGTLEVSAEFRLRGHCLELCYRARTDAPTPVNLTHHPYFNLAGDRLVPVAAQVLRIPAGHYLPVDAALIPTGQIADVHGTPFDFRVPGTLDAKRIAGDPQLARGKGYDHCLVLDPAHAACTAELYSPHSGVAMRLTSPMPAVQLYEGQMLDHSHPELGRGLCLEPQQFPDAPNHAGFPDTILRPGQDYLHRIEYRFGVPGRDAGWDEVVAALDRARAGG